MAGDSSIKVTIAFNDPDLDTEEQEQEAQKLLNQLIDLDEDEVEVARVRDPNPQERHKGFGFLVGMLTAEVNVANAQKLMGFLGERLGGKPIELSVEANGKKLTVKAHSREELEAAIKLAQDFIAP